MNSASSGAGLSNLLQRLRSRVPSHKSYRFGDDYRNGSKDIGASNVGANEAKRRFVPTGCRVGVMLACLLAFSVLLINISIFLWTLSSYQFENGTCTLFQGNCNKAKRLNTSFQLIINVLSTLLLSASNYCMQCLGAPSRKEIDNAHAKKVALEIGAPAPMNLKWISPYRAALWIILGLTALPIHFLYNSVLLLRAQANNYKIMAGPTNFLGTDFDAKAYYHQYNSDSNNSIEVASQALETRAAILSGTHEKLSIQDCHKNYFQQYVSRWGDVLLIQEGAVLQSNRSGLQIPPGMKRRDSTGSGVDTSTPVSFPVSSSFHSSYDVTYTRSLPLHSDPRGFPSNGWQCLTMEPFEQAGYCNTTTMEDVFGQKKDPWRPFGHDVQYCWAERVKEECSLAFHRGLGLAVIFCNLVKASCMCFTLFWMRRPGFITIGDAIESFLDQPDPHTEGSCTFSASQWNTYWNFQKCSTAWRTLIGSNKPQLPFKDLDKPWKPRKRRWWRSVSPFRWHSYILLLYALTAAVIALLMIEEQDGKFQLGLGTIPGKNILSLQPSLMGSVLIANLPQLFCSYIFLGFNYILTSMCAGREWMSYSQYRKMLRVTNPRGAQQSTFFLQLPYRFSIPLLALSGLISWLASQVLFIVQVRIRPNDKMSQASIMTCGYSPGALVILVIVGTVLALAVLLIGLRRFPDSMPLAATNSAAISAACHTVPEDEGCALKLLKWGVVSEGKKIGHCAFSAGLVKPLIAGKIYH